MFEGVGIALSSIVVAYFVFVVALCVMDLRGWWSSAGLAGFVPMIAVAFALSISAGGIFVWLVW